MRRLPTVPFLDEICDREIYPEWENLKFEISNAGSAPPNVLDHERVRAIIHPTDARTDSPYLMNEDSAKPPSFFDKPLHTAWKWLLVFLVALLASGAHFLVFEHASAGLQVNLVRLIGGAIFPFAIAMFFAIFFRGWKGVVIGVFFVLVVEGFIWSVNMNARAVKQQEQQQPATPPAAP